MPTPNTKIWRRQGGDQETFESGAELIFKDGSVLKIGDTDIREVLAAIATMGSTGAEIDARCDDSAMVETVVAAGAISVTKAVTTLTLPSGGAVTLAAPTKPGMQKIIMSSNTQTVTLALTNVVGGSAASTATFDAATEKLVLISDVAGGKWIVLKELGVTLS